MFQQSTAKYLQVCKCYYPTSIVRVNPRYKRSLVSSEASKAVCGRSLLFSTRILFLSLDKIVTHVTRATGLNLQLPVLLTNEHHIPGKTNAILSQIHHQLQKLTWLFFSFPDTVAHQAPEYFSLFCFWVSVWLMIQYSVLLGSSIFVSFGVSNVHFMRKPGTCWRATKVTAKKES